MPEIPCDLDHCFLCKHCVPEWKEAVGVKKKTLLFKKGQTILSEGQNVNGMYFVYSGVAKISMNWGADKELILRFARSGDILGLRGLGAESVYPISAYAVTDSKLCFIQNDFLEATLKTNASFTYELLHVYAAELHKAEKRMRDLAHMDVKRRIVLVLLELIELFGLDEENYVALPMRRQDIASFAGTSYETVFKFLTELAEAGIVTTTGKRIKVNQQGLLEKMLET